MELEQLKNTAYAMQYAAECNYIIKHLVPQSGQADSLQGELLRECEKLRYEAQNNGNWNWDEWFDFFCGHISSTLCEQDCFTEEEKQEFRDILDFFRSCGEYATFIIDNDDLPDDYPVDLKRIAYTEDNLYDRIADAIGKLHSVAGEKIPYTKNPDMYR